MNNYLISKLIVICSLIIDIHAFSFHRAQSFVPKKASSDLYLFRRQRPNHVDSNGALEKKSELASIEQIKKVDNDFDMLSDENEKKSTLKFGGKLSYESKPFPIPHDLSLLNDFLSSDEAEFILLSGGNNVTDIEYLTDDSMISDYMTRWKEEANRFGGELPRPGDSIVRVVPASIRILSVSILPKSVIGTTVIHNGILPEFQATLVDDTPTAQGPMPLVRLFNLIVNAGIKDKRNESAFLKLRVKMQEDNTCTFVADTEMYLEFNFPSLLLKLFPIKKEQSEKICSESIVNALKINLIPAIDSLYDKYLDYSAAHKEEDRGFQ